VNQALRPFPQYLTIDTSQSGGDKSGRSTYNALVLKLNHRLAAGLNMQWSYALAKLLTDSDTYYANSGFASDNGNRRIEKSIGQYDQTHVLKFNTIYELPFGKGRRWMTRGVLSQVIGGWRRAIEVYGSGLPLAVTRNNPLPIFNGSTRPSVTTYDGWLMPVDGRFDPAKNLYLNIAAFPTQLPYVIGNQTRYNPKARGFWNKNENISLSKTFPIKERFKLDFRGEAFNLLNRTILAIRTQPESAPSDGHRTISARQMGWRWLYSGGFDTPVLRNPLDGARGKIGEFSTIMDLTRVWSQRAYC
jgi:hypothetical protein